MGCTSENFHFGDSLGKFICYFMSDVCGFKDLFSDF